MFSLLALVFKEFTLNINHRIKGAELLIGPGIVIFLNLTTSLSS